MLDLIARPIYNYPGNKARHGVLQMILNKMPPHEAYAELYVGSGGIYANKKPAAINLVNDIDPSISYSWKRLSRPNTIATNLPGVIVGNILEGSKKKWLIYLDPPYLKETRRSSRDIYDYDDGDTAVHIDILNYISGSKHMIIISGYDNKLYNQKLKGWNKDQCTVSTHAGIAIETIWYNFPEPIALHDYKVLGKDFTDRQRIKRKVNRWIKKFDSLPVLEKELIYLELTKTKLLQDSQKQL